MKIVTYVSIVLLVLAIGGGAAFYFMEYQPLKETALNNEKTMKDSQAQLAREKANLLKLKENQSKEVAWIGPTIDLLSAGLANEIKAGLAEVVASGNRVIVNIAEQALYMPGSYTFSKESPPLRATLAGLLNNQQLKSRMFTIGNTTQAVPASGKGRKKVPAKDARSLAADRSSALIKDLEKSGVDSSALVAAAYSSKLPELGVKLKEKKTVILIEPVPASPQAASQSAPVAAQTSTASQPAPAAPQPVQGVKIPIQPAQPKAN